MEVVSLLLGGLHRLEYRGYDSAGLGVEAAPGQPTILVKATGAVARLEECLALRLEGEEEEAAACQLGIAHTRWATHGSPSGQTWLFVVCYLRL